MYLCMYYILLINVATFLFVISKINYRVKHEALLKILQILH